MPPQLGDVTQAAVAAAHASQGSDVFKGFPYSSGQREVGFHGRKRCPHLHWSASQGIGELGFRLTIIRARRQMGP